MPELRIGTCSWKYPSWHGLVYSHPKGIDYLKEYARTYNTVEVDQWFWSLFGENSIKMPSPYEVETYRNSVRNDFRFSVKVSNSITLTHFYRKKKNEPLKQNKSFLSPEVFQKFLRAIEPLHDVLGPLIFQFEYLNRQKMKSQNQFQRIFGDFIKEMPEAFQYAIEIRNPNYLNESYFEFLSANKLSHVFLQGYYMPDITGLYKKWRSYILKQPVSIIRLHGPGRQEIEKATGKEWNKIVSPKDEELENVAEMVEDLMDKGVDVYLNVTNHYEGSAPLTIEKIREFLKPVLRK